MKYTLTIQRKVGTNTYDSVLILITEDYGKLKLALSDVQGIFIQNHTYITTTTRRNEYSIDVAVEYDLTKGE